MQIKNIVNRDIVNLTNCEHEPIHIPGSIQPHGFLLALKTTDGTIDFCSANCNNFIQATNEQLLGKSLYAVIGMEQWQRVQTYLKADLDIVAPLTLPIAGKTFNCTIHKSADHYLLEFEPDTTEQLAVADIYLQTRQFTAYMQNATTLQSLCQAVADETRTITGYDRVMIYKFDEAYNGEVFAESCKDDVEPFLGLHYPHTDIPAQARELYIRNLLRLIADVNYTPIPLYTIDDRPGKNLDLSLSTLRSVSPIHVQYLQNMGVGATLTISLIFQGRLWGLIACHHYSPKYISMHTRIAAQLQGHFLTSQIAVRQDAEEYNVARKVNVALDVLLQQVFSQASLSFDSLIQQPELLQVANANGVFMLVDDRLYAAGKLPAEGECRKLANWLHTYSSPAGFNTHKLVEVYEDGRRCTDASGIIYHSLGSGRNDCIIWCRPEGLQEVNWAGDPQKAIVKDDKGLSPRKSFELWKEVKKCESLAWEKPELLAAASFSSALQKHVHMLFLSKEEMKQRKLSEKLQEANAELENINWIASHDLKEPLRKIQMFASRILEDDELESSKVITDSVQKMSDSAARMQLLIKDVLSYSRLNSIEDGMVPVNLNESMQIAVNDLESEIEEKKAVIQFANLPVVNGLPVLLQQLFINLLRNSLKFSKPNITPVITLQAYDADGNDEKFMSDAYYKVVYTDNGMGFDSQHNEAIFKVFTRLNPVKDFQGTGIGLALCRKVMQIHGGHISASSTEGEGATFHIYFPR